MATSNTRAEYRAAKVALDGPSALAFYRDNARRIDVAPRKAQLSKWTPEQVHDAEQWLSDEDVAMELATSHVFGKRPVGRYLDIRDADSGEAVMEHSRMRSLRGCAISSKDLKRIPYASYGVRPPSGDSTLYVMVPSSVKCRHINNVHERHCAKLPSSAFVAIDSTVYVPTPEFTFVLMARYLTMEELFAVGMELCGRYRLDGESVSAPVRFGQTTYDCGALTSPSRIAQFCD